MVKSIIAAIITILKAVPIPGFCFKKNQRLKVQTLTKKVTTPIDKSIFNDIPCARTLHGDAPEYDTINNPSPKPKIVKPKVR